MACAYKKDLGFRDGTFHVIMVVTDVSAHLAGDGRDLGIYVPNNHDDKLDGWPEGTGEDYPTKAGVKQVLLENDINPLFGIVKLNVIDFWKDLVKNDWENFGTVVEFTGDDVVSAILDGTKEVLSRAILAIIKDDIKLIQTITPNDGLNERNGIQLNVTRNTTIQFSLGLYADINNEDLYGINSTVSLRYVGFSSAVTLYITTAFQCMSCDPSNSSRFVDICGICGGDESNCTGCDGVLFSGAIKDRCDVCGGTGDSCLGCNGIPNSRVTFDMCGLCNGTNDTCKGCDGVPNSGLNINSCGVCGGPVNCDTTLVPVIIALSAFAGIAAAALIISLLLGLCVKVRMAHIEEMMIEEETALQENPLYEQAKQKYINPAYVGDKPNE